MCSQSRAELKHVRPLTKLRVPTNSERVRPPTDSFWDQGDDDEVRQRHFQQLLEEFKDKWQALAEQAIVHESPEESNKRFQESIYLRHFLGLLESRYQLPTQCRAPKMKVDARCESKALASSGAMEVSLHGRLFSRLRVKSTSAEFLK